MENKEAMLKKLGLKTMFNISDEEMPELIEEYDIFMKTSKLFKESRSYVGHLEVDYFSGTTLFSFIDPT